jgi:hypothetical protein
VISADNMPNPSTDESADLPWVVEKMRQLLDEFIDVSSDEKQFFHLWNEYLTHHPCTGKMQLFQITGMFVEERGKEVVEKGLYQNFCFHLANLQEFSLFSPHQVLDVVDQLQRLVKEHNLQEFKFKT